MVTNPHASSASEVITTLKSSPAGLTKEECVHRLEKYGHNEMPDHQKVSKLTIFIHQFKNSIVFLLFGAAVISLLFRDYAESIAIFVVIVINAIIGYILEAHAISSMEALRKLDKIYALVVRNGNVEEIDARDLVPGDVIVLEAGNIIPADARLIELASLEVNESALTGESISVSKDEGVVLDKETVLADRINMVFKGTSISRGNARAVVTGTGLNTEVGTISKMVKEAQKDEVPLNKKLNVFSRKLIWLTIIIIIPFFAVGMIRGNQLHIMLETAIALAVAAIPEGLPIVATISLAKGMLRLAQSNVIVKKLAAVETLGETDVIITDKTGTLTENELKVEEVHLSNNDSSPILKLVAVLCNNASINDKGVAIGDPVETALLKYVNEQDSLFIDNAQDEWHEVDEKPFDSTSRYMANLYQGSSGYFVTAKGSPAEILEICQFIDSKNGPGPLNKLVKDQWLDKTNNLSSLGLKVLGFAFKKPNNSDQNYDQDLIFLGLVGFLDPPRADVKQSIHECHEAEIKVIMATGDHSETAKAIAKQIGLFQDNDKINVIHGKDFTVTDSKKLDDTLIFSRVTPEQKLNLINHFQKKGLVIGMTGDGVNDAPALKKADVGIAMGVRGTQVAKDAADMVLQDDSFSSIVKAIKQGRTIFKNIKNFIIYLLSCNLTEIMVVAIAAFTNVSLPLLPLQILFLNLVTDVFPSLALGMGEGNPSIMKYKSRDADDAILSRKNWISIVVYSATMTISILALYYISIFYFKHDVVTSNNIAFYTLAFSQLWHPFNLIDRRDNLLKNEIVKNLHLWLAIVFCIILLFLTYFVPFLKEVLEIGVLEKEIWLYIIGASLIPLIIIRPLKLLKIVK
ncbi:HAD-IC family P-type ATPase [Mangrovivirga sp. M17]|uniref:HAD-IC family P-type ATPase n=1 Tax=Mangrovivirga halotolerans TaxID=2993936 RepID=A0ABT3RPV2_9BACT|nr:HAD-IC family P-type ATPase [Mangrovivirga halotolerans]MCX2743819.1 HAD-IC family P-type ATPase [Mangrovivirga halotolerans]